MVKGGKKRTVIVVIFYFNYFGIFSLSYTTHKTGAWDTQ